MFVQEALSDEPVFGGSDLVDVEWVGVMHAGYELSEGSEAEACLRSAHRRVEGGDLGAYVMTCYLDAAVFAVHGNIPSLVYRPIAGNNHRSTMIGPYDASIAVSGPSKTVAPMTPARLAPSQAASLALSVQSPTTPARSAIRQ